MQCEDRASLLDKYTQATASYQEAVQKVRNGYDLPDMEFILLCKLAQGAKEICEVARRALDSHVAEHNC
jgi:hypothetical protein